MVFLKRTLDCGVNGYHSPAIPRAPRSRRKREFRPKTLECGQLCAFELLATVAGKLLEESECSSASSSAAVGFDQCGIDKGSIKQEPQDVDKPLGGEHDDQGSSEGSVFFSGLQRDVRKGKLEKANEVTGDHASPFASSACSEKVDFVSNLVTQKSVDASVKHTNKVEGGSPKCGESDDTNNLENGLIRKLETNGGSSGDITMANKSPASINTEENVELTLCRDPNLNASFLKHGNDVKIGCKEKDEIISRCSQPNNKTKAFRSPGCAGDPKLLTTKYWKTAPKLKDYELSNTDGEAKQNYSSKRCCYDIDRTQRNTPFKKRRLFDRSSVVTYDGGISCESVSNSPEKCVDDEKNASAGKLHEGGIGTSASGFCRQKSCNSRNSHVRLNIKSFKVPELFIEVPESTTVGSLKSTVLEAVTTVLGGGLRVGVLLQGKKIRDDNSTLIESGISHSDDMDTVGFMLEPNSPTRSPRQCTDEHTAPLPCDSPKLVNRSHVIPNNDRFAVNTPDKPSITNSNRPSGIVKDLVLSPTTELTEKTVSNSKALVPVPEAIGDALAIVPVNQRSKRSDIGQRRTRRPFSVGEVEALVRAVEKLGTGRWRDVKLCAFDNAKHRTYVDLKDKWKTLVHTARISPQQRRGEPVPQELLDRVLAAQAYWTDHQAKQHGKQQQQQQQGIIPKLSEAVIGKA